MSERGWRQFLNGGGTDDWVVLHGGAAAVFEVSSLVAATKLAGAVAGIPGVQDLGVVLTVTDHHLSVRLSRDVWHLDDHHLDLARAISAEAREQGAVADRARVHEVQLAIAAKPDAVDVGFWRTVLGYAPASDDNAVDPLGHGSTVWMQSLAEEKPLRHAMHVDVSVARERVEARVAAALAAGGRLVDSTEAPSTWILQDAAGNRVCICAWPDGATSPSPE